MEMNKVQTSKWVERQRTSLGMQVRPASGGPGTYTYAHIVWRVLEQAGDQWRERVISGRALYLHEHPELALAFQVAIPALVEIERACALLDQSPQPVTE